MIVKPRHAIVLVHGQGEQRPMEMGPQFVEHVFMADFNAETANVSSDPQVRWVPESIKDIEETRRIEIRYADARPDYDVFELYWAPLMGDTQFSHFAMWFFGLLRRPRSQMPTRVRFVHTLSKILVWCAIILTGFYLYTTFCALFPVQVIQIMSNGASDIFQFSFDWRLAAILSALLFFLAALASAVVRNYGWSLSFLVSTCGICAASPLLLGSTDRIRADIAWIEENYFPEEQKLDFNIWGLRLDANKGVRVGPITESAAALSRFLCGTKEESKSSGPESLLPEGFGDEQSEKNIGSADTGSLLPRASNESDAVDPDGNGSTVEMAARAAAEAAEAVDFASQSSVDEANAQGSASSNESDTIDPRSAMGAVIARREIDLFFSRPLQWSDMEPKRGAQLKDICLAPIALSNPVLYARVADSAHILLTTLIVLLYVFSYCIWRAFLRIFVVDIMGDSARYLNNHPKNNIARHNIRQSGLTMLKALHTSGRYDRIYVVAHSLGSIVAYDMLRQYWGQVVSDGLKVSNAKLLKSKAAAQNIEDHDASIDALKEWQQTQFDVFLDLRKKWLVSDFITLGSPLSYGRLFLEGSSDCVHPSSKFESQRDVTRSVPSCPPVDIVLATEQLRPWDIFLAVRWSNIFFANDIVAGNVSSDSDGLLFGKGINELVFKPTKMIAPGLSHNSYWTSRMQPLEGADVPWLSSLRTILGI